MAAQVSSTASREALSSSSRLRSSTRLAAYKETCRTHQIMLVGDQGRQLEHDNMREM